MLSKYQSLILKIVSQQAYHVSSAVSLKHSRELLFPSVTMCPIYWYEHNENPYTNETGFPNLTLHHFPLIEHSYQEQNG